MRLLSIIVTLISTVILQGCASFKPLPDNVENISAVSGMYLNDCDTTENKTHRKLKLWNFIDKNYKDPQDSLQVKIELSADNKLKAQLISQDSIIAEKLMKGKVTNDVTYEGKKVFYVVPILPVLYWYRNDKKRFYYANNQLVVDWTYNTGGVVIIMAGGDKNNSQWHFNKLK